MKKSFKLPDTFVNQYTHDPFGFNGLGLTVFYRTYSRQKDDGTMESWADVCRRVIEWMFSVQKNRMEELGNYWNEEKAQSSAKDAYDRMYNLKWSPPGRGLWLAGSDFIYERNKVEALNNCSFISTKDIYENPGEIFGWIMDYLMLGVGVGYDVRGADKVKIQKPEHPKKTFVIPDSREGWVESVIKLINSYTMPNSTVITFDYSQIRAKGEKINGFGGTSSGYEPLKKLHERIDNLFIGREGQLVSATDIADIANMIAGCVIAGNVRRSAQIVLGPDSNEFLDLKNYAVNPQREEWGWASNNSVIVSSPDSVNYKEIAKRIFNNGEPGLFWEKNVQNYGRMGELKRDNAIGTNPCAEQPLESYEMCVSGDTKIHTRHGIYNIKDITGKEVEIWNGEKWAKVTPFPTGRNKLYRVHMSDGSYLDVTPGHKWIVKNRTQSKFKEMETTELKRGMITPYFQIKEADGRRVERAYEIGWFIGDGYMDKNKVMAVIQRSEYAVAEIRDWKLYKEQQPDGYKEPYSRINFSEYIDINLGVQLRNKTLGLPQEIMEMDPYSIKEFLAGWIDTDGSVAKNKNTEHFVLYGTEAHLRDLQILLRRININHASVRLWQPSGTKTNFGVRNYDIYRLTIPSHECVGIPTILKTINKFGTGYAENNAHNKSMPTKTGRRQKIEKIEFISNNSETFCFEEKELGQGVFGNVLTKQCTLSEVYLGKHKSVFDLMKTIKFAYLYAKSVALTNDLIEHPKTREVMTRNRRIGLSLTGVAQFLDAHSLTELIEWMKLGYAEVQRYDNVYSSWLRIPKSIRTTTIKPSGTVSLLAGSTPGVHFPMSRYYIRRIRISDSSPLVPLLREAGYHIEEDVYSDNTLVVSYPVDSGARRSEKDVSPWEQLKIASLAQKYWSDNGVSITVKFDPDKTSINDIESMLEHYQHELKAVSFLPDVGTGAYAQMPYESIEEARYNQMISELKPIDFGKLSGARDMVDLYCDGDACIIPV